MATASRNPWDADPVAPTQAPWASDPVVTSAKNPWDTDPVAAPAARTPTTQPPANPEANVKKFLDFLGRAEGADYNTIVGGKQFTDFRAHPRVVGLRTAEGPSTAAGKYQIVGTTYDAVAPKLGIRDFTPDSQDKIAIELIRQKGALEDVRNGNFDAAIGKLGNIWASLPSSPYSQPKRSAEWVAKELGSPTTVQYQNFAAVRKDIDPKTLNKDVDWLRASELLYNFYERKPFQGTKDDLAEWGKDSLGNFNFNLVSMAEIAYALQSASQEEKEAFLFMMDTYDNTNFSLEGAGRAAKGIVTDPTNLVGLGTLGVGFLGKFAGKQAAKAGIRKLVLDSLARTGIGAGIQSGVFGAADSTIRQGLEVSAGRREEIDLSKVGVDAAIAGTAGVILGTAADAAVTKVVGVIKGRKAVDTPTVPGEAPKAPASPDPNVAGVTPQAEAKAASGQMELFPTGLSPAEELGLIQRQQDGRLRADEIVPNVGADVPKIDVPQSNTGLRTTRLTDEPVAPLSKVELAQQADVVVTQLRDVETKDLPAVLETLRTRSDLSREEIRVVDKAVQNYKNEVVVELATLRKERMALDAKTALSEPEVIRQQELAARIEDLEARVGSAQLADDATGSMAGSILQDRQDPMNALKGVTVESIMTERGVTKVEAEQVWAEMVGKAHLQSEAQKISAVYDDMATKALEADDLEGAMKAAILKNRELNAKVEALAPKGASFVDKLTEFAISNVFSIKTIIINLIPSGLKTLVIPGLKAILSNPFEKATRAEAAASYSAMRSSFGAALNAAKAGFRYEQAILSRDGTRLVEGEMAMSGRLAGSWRIFPRILNASDEFLSRLNYDSFVAGKAAAEAAMEGTEKGLKGKALDDFISEASKKALDASMKPTSGDELVQPIINKGLNLGLTGEDLFKWVEKEAMRDPQSLRKGNDEDALNFVRDVLYKRKFSGEGSMSKAAQAYEDAMKKFPTIKLVIGQLFFRTPIRVFEEGIRLTPGLQFVAPNFMKDLAGANGALRQVRAQAEAMTSLVIASGVLSLYAQGRITGDNAYEDYKQQKTRVDGPLPEPYTIKMSDGSTWNYRGFDPLATPVKIMVNALQRMDQLRLREAQGEFVEKDAYKYPLAAVTVASMSIASAIRDASLVEGADNFAKFVKTAFNPEEGESAFIKILGDKLFLLVPNTLHKIARDNDPQIRDPQTFWQMVEQKLLRPVGLDDPAKTAFAYDVLGNTRKMSDTGSLWNVFSTASVEERAKGMNEKEQFVLTEMDRLSRVTGVTFKPPVKAKEMGDADMRTIMAADGKRTLYDVWQQNYKSLKPEDVLYPILKAPLPEGTFKYRAAKVEEAQAVINDLQSAAMAMTMQQEQKVVDKYISQELLKAKSKAGLFDTPRPY
jgi:muramidase (phage lysozyme)